jgi:hypothetical protein
MGASKTATTSTQEQDAVKRLLHNQNTGLSTDTRPATSTDPFANEDGAEVKYKTMEWW